MIGTVATGEAVELKSCCASLYESDLARLLLGDSFHPGGLALTGRLGELLQLRPGQRVLDVASGKGTTAIYLAQRFDCEVVGVDYGTEAVKEATARAGAAGVSHLVSFEQGDAEGLRFSPRSFDAVICECAFCTFPNKEAAAREWARVLRPGGRVGLSDLARSGPLPPELEGLLAWIACIADARPIAEYVVVLQGAGLAIGQVEPHNAALEEMVRDVRTKLLGAELLSKLKKIELPPGIDLAEGKSLVRHAAEAVRAGKLGYVVIVGAKPAT
jgi:ubiquinone/menaquinone biosynthesis C-methylase UbiE